METFIRTQLGNYNKFKKEANMHARLLKLHDSEARRVKLTLLLAKVASIDYWMGMLTVDQQFVVKRHLVDGLEWARVTIEYNQIWGEFSRTERTLIKYMVIALETICMYVEENKEEVIALFEVPTGKVFKH